MNTDTWRTTFTPLRGALPARSRQEKGGDEAFEIRGDGPSSTHPCIRTREEFYLHPRVRGRTGAWLARGTADEWLR